MNIDQAATAAAVSLACLLAGCAGTIPQAPLVYVSKQSVGIDISTGMVESGGIAAHVGFRNLDAAYVPVAVTTEGYKLEIVQGRSKDSVKVVSPDGEADKATTEIASLKEASLREVAESGKKKLDASDTLRNDNRGDAFSVYGSFDTGGSGERQSVGFNIGKIFSTGIAAQNLTRTAEGRARADSVTGCISKLLELASKMSDSDVGKKDAAIASAMLNCRN